jgi:hypothetical protein
VVAEQHGTDEGGDDEEAAASPTPACLSSSEERTPKRAKTQNMTTAAIESWTAVGS